jgi:4-hydroxy-tetrahydrodipicolinate synthase
MARPVVYSAVPTAFEPDGTLDVASTARIFEHALAGGVDALFVNGTTGEFPALSMDERRILLRTAVDVAGADRVIAHVGSAAPYHTGTLTTDAIDLGITRLSVLTPYYLPAGVEGVRRQLQAVTSRAPDAEVFLYVFPDRTGVQLDPEEAAGMLEDLDLLGIKVSIAGTDYVARVVAALARPRVVLSGNDGLLPAVIAAGGAGIVSGVSASLPRAFVAMADALHHADADRQALLQRAINDIVPVLGPSIAGLKFSLFLQGVISAPTCRMAIDEPDADRKARIADAVSRAGDLTAPVG